jgi:hypothetical protein
VDNPRKSSYSHDGGCVGIGECRKSSYSLGNLACIGIGQGSEGVGVQDTKQDGQANRTELRFSSVSWGKFLQRVRNGECV